MELTVFTPTYNRTSEIPGLYESIKKAICFCPEKVSVCWLIVDDGSKEDVESVIKTFSEIEGLKIQYVRKENGGKHTAFNKAIDLCETELFVCIDDDDRLTENAIHDIFEHAKTFANQGYGAVVGRVVSETGELLGQTRFEGYLISDTIEIRDKHDFWGEPEVYFTEVLRKYRFDVFENERFLTEAYLFDRMSKEYPFVYVNTPFMEKKYLPGGLTDNQLKIRIESPVGTEAYYYQRSVMSDAFRCKLKAAINRQRFAYWINGEKPKRDCRILDVLAAPVAFLMYLNDKKAYRKKR